MAQSIVTISQKSNFVKDGAIGRFLEMILEQMSEMKNKEIENLKKSFQNCLLEHEEFTAPGLRDLDLDQVLDNSKKKQEFVSILREIKKNPNFEKEYHTVKDFFDMLYKTIES